MPISGKPEIGCSLSLARPGHGGCLPRRYSVPAKPACCTTLPQRTISALMKRCSSSGEEGYAGIMPSLIICCCTSGDASALLSAACSLLTTSLGVPAGTENTPQPAASKPGTPASAVGGISH